MNTLLVILRWAAFVPAALVAYIVATWAVFFGFTYAIPEVATTVRYAPDFAGHIIFGPLIVFTWFSVATAMAVYAGISVAPSHRKIAASILGLVVVTFICIAILGLVLLPDRHLLTGQMWFRTSTELVGMVTGLATGIALAYENGSFLDQTRKSIHRGHEMRPPIPTDTDLQERLRLFEKYLEDKYQRTNEEFEKNSNNMDRRSILKAERAEVAIIQSEFRLLFDRELREP